VVTVKVADVEPAALLHVPPTLPESTTLPPAQKVVAPPAEITDTVGFITAETTLL